MSHPMQHMQWAVMGLVSIEDSQEREPGVAQECLEILVLWSGRGRGPKIYPTAPKYGTSLTGTKPFIDNIHRGVRSKSTRHSACTIPQKPTGICTPTLLSGRTRPELLEGFGSNPQLCTERLDQGLFGGFWSK